MVMKADVVISPAAIACSWIWLWAQTRDLHVCLRGFPSGPGFLPRHKDMQAILTCKSLFLQVNVFGTWKTKPPNQSVPMGVWTKTCTWFVFCNEFFFSFFFFFRSQTEGSKIIDQCMKIESEVIELMTGWQLQDLLSWFNTELTLASGWNRFSVKLMPAKTSIKDF